MGVDHITFPTMSADIKVSRLESQLRQATGGQIRKTQRKLDQARAEQRRAHERVALERQQGMHRW